MYIITSMLSVALQALTTGHDYWWHLAPGVRQGARRRDSYGVNKTRLNVFTVFSDFFI